MTRSGCPSPAELLAYDDDELPPPRQAEVHLHVQQCCDCRIWLNEARTLGRRLRQVAPVVDDDAGLTVLRARLAEQRTTKGARTQPWRPRILAVPLAALSLALIVTLGISVFTTSSVVEGGSTFARWIMLEPFIARVTPDQDPAQIIVAPTGVPQPPSLPFGLGMISEERGEHSIQRHYTAPNGLWILFSAERDAPPALSSGTLGLRTIQILDGRDVLLEEGPLPDAIHLMAWSDGDVLMRVLVMRQPKGNLNAAAALEIVAALIEEGVEVP